MKDLIAALTMSILPLLAIIIFQKATGGVNWGITSGIFLLAVAGHFLLTKLGLLPKVEPEYTDS